MIQTRRPTHPGTVFYEDVMKPLHLSVTKTAQLLGVSRKDLSEFVHEKCSLRPDMAIRISIATGTSAESWMNMQQKLTLWTAEQIALNDKHIYNINTNFEWDENKEKINIKKHGIDFKSAAKVFLDDNRLELADYEHSTVDEERFISIGMINERLALVTVVHTDRNDAIRIISARYATKQEEEWYYDDNY